uniref:Protein FLX-like 2 n=1 Tax=Rhizophora mucronata TaxID=61149 RepID=A0A2P2IQ55_RHIMU
MGSKGQIPGLHLRRSLPGPGLLHPDSFGPGVRPPPGPFPPFEMLPPPEVMEQKLAAQHVEMQRLATENHRLAATHGTLRQELASAKLELQVLHVHIGAIRSEREQQMSGLMDKFASMEAELKDAEPVRLELQQARADAEKLVVTRQELLSKVHQLNQDLHRVHADVQQIPALMSELESLRQEYQQCRYLVCCCFWCFWIEKN